MIRKNKIYYRLKNCRQCHKKINHDTATLNRSVQTCSFNCYSKYRYKTNKKWRLSRNKSASLWDQKNPEKVKLIEIAYLKRGKILNKKYRKKNREKIRLQKRGYYLKNREIIIARNIAYRKKKKKAGE